MIIRRHLRGGMVRPNFAASIDWGHPLAANLQGVWLFNERSVIASLVNPNDALTLSGGGFGWTSSQLGVTTFDTQGINRGYLLTTPSAGLKPANAASIFWRGLFGSAGSLANNPPIFGMSAQSSTTSSPFYSYGINRVSGAAASVLYGDDAAGSFSQDVIASLIPTTPTPPLTVGLTFKNGGNRSGYYNGRKVASSARTGVLTYFGTATLRVGLDSGGDGGQLNDICYMWGRELSANEMQWLNVEPYAFLNYLTPRTFFFGKILGQALTMPALASAEALGALTVKRQQFVRPSGIASAEAVGALTVRRQQFVRPAGIASAEALGALTVVKKLQFLTPAGIASAEALGALDVVLGKIVAPAGIPSAAAFGALTVSNVFPQTVTLPSIGSGQLIGLPKIAGPLSMPSIGSAAAVGALRVLAKQTIAPSGIPSAEAVGALVIRRILSIRPAGIPSAEAHGALTISGGRKWVYLPGIYEGKTGALAIRGGDRGLSIRVAGIERVSLLQPNTATVSSQTIGRWNASATFRDPSGAFDPKIGQLFLVQENNRKFFAGCIQQQTRRRPLGQQSLTFYDIVAVDKTGACDRRVISARTYTAEMDAADVLRDIVTTCLDGEGFTTNGIPDSMGPLGIDLAFNYAYVRGGFDQIASLTGTVWFATIDGDLTFSSFVDLPAAPFSLSETSKNWRNLTARTSTLDFRTKEYAVSDRNVIPGSSSAAGTFGKTFVVDPLPQQEAVDRAFILGSIILPEWAVSIVSLKVNGVLKPVYVPSLTPVDTSLVWWWFPPVQYLVPPTAGADLPHVGDRVEVVYVPYSNSVASQVGTALDPENPPESPDNLGTCGSGIYEHVTQVKGIKYSDDLLAIAAAELARSGGLPTFVNFETDDPGLEPGQKLLVNVPRLGLANKQLVVTSVSGRSTWAQKPDGAGGFLVDLGKGSSFRWQVQTSSNQDPGNWTNYIQRLIGRTEQGQPITRYELLKFILGAGGSLAGGTSITNPNPVTESGRAATIKIAASVPPIDQDLIITIRRNNVVVGSVTLAAGSAANTLSTYTFPADAGVYFYADDIASADASYRVTGSTPAAASGVTVILAIAI